MSTDCLEIQQHLTQQLAGLLGLPVEAIAPRSRFRDLGLESIRVPAFLQSLSLPGAQRLAPRILADYPTIEALAAYLAGKVPEAPAMRATPGAESLCEPIAVVGLALRFPGAEDPTAFWRLLRSGQEAVGPFAARRAGRLAGVDQFDAGFFAISPREAQQMDPQQRLSLELAAEAFGSAGIPLEQLRDSATGVFMGAMWSEYGQGGAGKGAPLTPHSATGRDISVISGRISYVLGLQGPSLTVNTACSSSLVAVHLACNSLRLGECDLALAGGVNLLLSPQTFTAMEQLGVLSPGGRCKAFDASADGYVRSEGAGAVVLRRLSDALAANDRILALLPGSAVNSDGFSNGLTTPSGKAQTAVMRRALQTAGVAPLEIQYTEAHGTGTPVGDPIEAAAIGAVYGAGRPAAEPVLVGSVKTNIGHAEAAAGIAGLIKVILAQQECAIPPSLHFHSGNPEIAFDAAGLRVATELQPWHARDRRMLAGVSSFGFSGTNCHVIVEGCPAGPSQLFLLAAGEPSGLAEAVATTRARLAGVQDDASSLAGLARELAGLDAQAGYRLGIVADSRQELSSRLEALSAALPTMARPGAGGGKLAFVFSGNGSQWEGMGRSLLLTEPVFRQEVLRVDRAVRQQAGWSVVDVMVGTAKRSLSDVTVGQTLLFAVQLGLARLFESLGVAPAAVVGQSVGEVAAAAVAGILPVAEAVRVVLLRSELQARKQGQGGMAVVRLPEAAVRALLVGEFAHLYVSGTNSPTNTNISGPKDVLAAFVARYAGSEISVLPIDVSIAYHSPYMDPEAAELVRRLGAVATGPARLPMYSTVAARAVSGQECDAGYWGRNLREPVLLDRAMQQLVRDGITHCVEISPHPVLLAPLRECLRAAGSRGTAYGSMYRNATGRRQLFQTLGSLFEQGFPVGPGAAVAGPEQPELFVLSAHGRESLQRRGERLLAMLDAGAFPSLADLCAQAAHRESHWRQRVAVVATSLHDLGAKLRARLAEGTARVEEAGGDREQVLQRAAELYESGADLDWAALMPAPVRLSPFPGIAWEKQSYWLPGEAPPAAVEPPAGGTVQYYAELARQEQLGNFVRFGALARPIPGFSWLRAWVSGAMDSELRATALAAIEQMRDAAFRAVDFGQVRSALDIGCGYGSDLVWLARQYPHLTLYGNNISGDQINKAQQIVAEAQVADRVHIRYMDSVTGDLGGPFELIFSFQVLHHISDKAQVLRNLSRHLAPGGRCVFVEIVSKLASAIDHAESSAYFAPVDDWAAWLAGAGLRVTDCRDASEPVANYLYDPDFETNLGAVAREFGAGSVEHLRGPNALSTLLRRQLAGYYLMQLTRDDAMEPGALLAHNRRLLGSPNPYVPGLAGAGAAPAARPETEQVEGDTGAVVRRELAAILLLPEARIEPDRPMGEYGLDSMLGLQLRARLEALFRVRLPATALYNYPTVAALAAHIGRLTAEGGGQSQTKAMAMLLELEKELKDVWTN